MKFKLIKIWTLILAVVLLMCGWRNVKEDVPDEIMNGYEACDYEIYKKAAKENGKLYDKLYVIGKLIDEPFEDKELLSCYFRDEKNRKYYLKIDSKLTKQKNDYLNLKNKNICVCGTYSGSLKKDPMPVLLVNKIYDMQNKKTLSSIYYGDYYGDFDEKGKIISRDYDEDDNTLIDFHSIQIQVPYNYKEVELGESVGGYIIQGEDLFVIIRKEEDLSKVLSDSKLKSLLKNEIKANSNLLKNQMGGFSLVAGDIKVLNIRDGNYENVILYNFENDDMYGYGADILKNDGVYVLLLLTDKNSRFNREQDFI